MSEINSVEPFADGFITALCPELIIFVGLILLIIVPNLGKGTVRIPGTQARVMWFLGGNRFSLTSNPKLPAWIATITLGAAFVQTMLAPFAGLGWGRNGRRALQHRNGQRSP